MCANYRNEVSIINLSAVTETRQQFFIAFSLTHSIEYRIDSTCRYIFFHDFIHKLSASADTEDKQIIHKSSENFTSEHLSLCEEDRDKNKHEQDTERRRERKKLWNRFASNYNNRKLCQKMFSLCTKFASLHLRFLKNFSSNDDVVNKCKFRGKISFNWKNSFRIKKVNPFIEQVLHKEFQFLLSLAVPTLTHEHTRMIWK